MIFEWCVYFVRLFMVFVIISTCYIISKLLESVLNGSVVYIFATCSRFWANHVYYFKINIATADLLVGIQAILGFVQYSIPLFDSTYDNFINHELFKIENVFKLALLPLNVA